MMCYFNFGLLLLFYVILGTADAANCPHPAADLNTRVTAAELSPGSLATYSCDPGYELFGGSSRTCGADGNWSGDMPVCATNVAFRKPVNQSSTVRGGEGVNANDGDRTTVHDGNKCTQTTTEDSPWWSVDLLQEYEIERVRITTRGCCGQDPVQDLEVRIGDSDQLQRNRLCAWLPGIIEEGSTEELKCARSMKGRYVFVQMSGVRASLSLCEVEVFSKSEFNKDRCRADVEASHLGIFNQTCYEFQVISGGNFRIARDRCQKRRRGDLVQGISGLTQNYLVSELQRLAPGMEPKMVWIGVQKEPQFISRTWRWIDGTKVKRPSWGRGQPNNYNGKQNCVVLDGGMGWLWNDVGCDLNYLFWMCQFQPFCGTPDRNTNTTFSLIPSGHEVTAVYSCPEGSMVVGDVNRTCLGSGYWNGESPTCKYIDCGEPTVIEYGKVSKIDQRTTYGAKVLYSCAENYTLSGESTMTCGDKSEWQPTLPRCLYSWCPSLDSIQNGRIETTGRQAGHSAVYTCDVGYNLIGTSNLTCLLGGKWSGVPPHCEYVDCGMPEHLENGEMDLLNKTTYLNSVAEYKCHEDFKLIGQSFRVCDHSGYWTGGRPTCERINCGEPEIPVGGYVTGYSFDVHSAVEYHCEAGHYMTGKAERICMRNGEWSNETPTCTYVDCGRLPPIIKGDVQFIDESEATHLDAHVLYTCNRNHRMVGTADRVCERNGKWSGETPRCEEIRCLEAQHPPNSRVTISGNDRRLPVTRTSSQLSGNRTYKVGSQVTYRCERGHAVSGPTIRTCLNDGVWSAEAPQCVYVDCRLPEDIEHGVYRLLSNETHYGAIASYECDANWKIDGKLRRFCLANGTWSLPVPSCEKILCSSLDEELSRRYKAEDQASLESPSWNKEIMKRRKERMELRLLVNDGSRTVGSYATYSCSEGRKVVGNTRRECKQHGVWDGKEPKCEWVYCSKPREIVNGRVHSRGDSFIYNSVVEYFCLQKYSLRGSFNRTCTMDGLWSGEEPSCVLSDLDLGVFDDNTIEGTSNLAREGLGGQPTEGSYIGIYVGVAVSFILALAVGLALLFFKTRKLKPGKATPVVHPSHAKVLDGPTTVVGYDGEIIDSSTGNNIYEHIPDDLGPSYANISPSDSFSSSTSYPNNNTNHLNGRTHESQPIDLRTTRENGVNVAGRGAIPPHISRRPRMPPPQPPSEFRGPSPSSAGVTINGMSIAGTPT